MLTDEALSSLPDDPELAFIALVDWLDAWLEKEIHRRDGYTDWYLEFEYADTLRAFVDEFGLDVPIRNYDQDNFRDRDGNLDESAWWTKFIGDIRYFKTRLQFRRKGTQMLAAATVVLNDQRRAEIHALLNKIRKVVAVLEVTERKRDRIYARVAALAKEVDTSKTRYGTLLGLILETSETGGQSAEKLEPLVKLVHRVTGTVADQQAENEQQRLPPPTEQKRLEPPSQGDLDDEIPF